MIKQCALNSEENNSQWEGKRKLNWLILCQIYKLEVCPPGSGDGFIKSTSKKKKVENEKIKKGICLLKENSRSYIAKDTWP